MGKYLDYAGHLDRFKSIQRIVNDLARPPTTAATNCALADATRELVQSYRANRITAPALGSFLQDYVLLFPGDKPPAVVVVGEAFGRGSESHK